MSTTEKKHVLNKLYYGDNLEILRQYIADESVDLIYLDPPFNSARSYNVLFKDESGKHSDAQITAFEDTWHWGATAERTYNDLVTGNVAKIPDVMSAMRSLIGTNQMMAYLVMMTARLAELHRVLKPTGSLYLHCDSTASHYLKIVLDAIFGAENFRNEIVWKRSDTHNDAKKQYAAVGDRILFYTKTKNARFIPQFTGFQEKTLREWYQYLELPDGTTRRMTKQERESQEIPKGARRFNTDNLTSPNPRPNLVYEYKGYQPHQYGWRVSKEKMADLDKKGLLIFPANKDGRIMRKRYLDEQQGAVLGDVWTDISQIRAHDAERLNYPTQKPVALLERIVAASSNEGDVVLDPFCGCGTAIAAAQNLGRNWIGIDITHLSVALQKYRLKGNFELEPKRDYVVIGEPEDVGSARQLANDDRFQFQAWALSLIKARPLGGSQTDKGGAKTAAKGADKGIDGVMNFITDKSGKAQRILIQVKSGKVGSPAIRDLVGTIQRENAAMGILITLEKPTKEMIKEAVSAGYFKYLGHDDYPKIQIVTIAELLEGKLPALPPSSVTFKQAERIKQTTGEAQLGLFED